VQLDNRGKDRVIALAALVEALQERQVVVVADGLAVVGHDTVEPFVEQAQVVQVDLLQRLVGGAHALQGLDEHIGPGTA